MPFPCVLRVQPVELGNLRGADVHQSRRGGDGTTPNVAVARTRLNRRLVGSGNVEHDVLAILSRFQKAHPKTTPCAEMVLTADDEYFTSICPGWRNGVYTQGFKDWVNTNLRWLKERYPGVASVTLHMDEGTPHLHAMIVPLATYEQRFRRGAKEVTKVAYNRVFGDDAQVIAQARMTGNSELTKLGRLQTEYADVMQPLGLVRGIKNSRAHHRSVQQYQEDVNRPLPDQPVKPNIVLPERTAGQALASALGIDTEYDKAVADSEMETARYESDEASYRSQLLAKAKEFDRMKEQNDQMRATLTQKDEQIRELAKELTLTKEVIDKLRKSPLQDVAQRLGYDGPIEDQNGKPKWKGAIDMAKDVGGFDYKEAVAWLYHEFGGQESFYIMANEAIGAVQSDIQAAEQEKPARPYTRQEYAVIKSLERQMDALQADAYRITMMHPEPGRTYNVGKGKGDNGSERLYSRDEVLAMVPKLNMDNWRRDYNVFLTPFSKDVHYVLVDDCTTETLAKLKAAGYRPSLVQQSSSQSIQSVILLPKDKADASVGNVLFRELNAEYGDPRITGFLHPFRAAGFRNVKPKHLDKQTGRFPAVTIVEAVRTVCQKAVERCVEILRVTDLSQAPTSTEQAKRAVQKRVFEVPVVSQVDSKIDRIAKQFYGWCAHRWGDLPTGVDWSKADWMLIKRLDEAQYAPSDIAAVIRKNSPGLEERHPDFARYLSDTMDNALPKPK